MTFLAQFYAFQNQLTGTLPTQWTMWSKMGDLELSDNQLTGTLPTQWSIMNQMTDLELARNQLSGTIPFQWSSMTLLVYLYLYNNSLSGTLPSQWTSMTSLLNLEFDSNQLTGTVPAGWSTAMPALQVLYLNNNSLSGTLPASWQSMSQMKTLVLNHNRFSGSLPSQWSTMTALQYFSVTNNSVSGTLPFQWQTMTKMRWCYAANNLLSGSLPSQWSTWKSVEVLDVSGNSLSGTLPSQWATWTLLQNLTAQNNMLNGTLPSSWQSLRNVTILAVDNNTLVGTLPPQWSSLTYLKSLSLSANRIRGVVPAQWAAGMVNITSTFACNVTCSGTIGLNANCSPEVDPASSCLSIALWYTCVSLFALPPVLTSNAWNWNTSAMFFGPRAPDCQTHSSSLSPSASRSSEITASPGSATLPRSQSFSDSFSSELSFSDSKSQELASFSESPSGTWSEEHSRSLGSLSLPSSATRSGSGSADGASRTASLSDAKSSTTLSPMRNRSVSEALTPSVNSATIGSSASVTEGTFTPAWSLTLSLSPRRLPQVDTPSILPSATAGSFSRSPSWTKESASRDASGTVTASKGTPSWSKNNTSVTSTVSSSNSNPSASRSITARTSTLPRTKTPTKSTSRQSVSSSRSLGDSAALNMSHSLTESVIPAPPAMEPVRFVIVAAVQEATTTMGTVSAAGTLLGVDPGGAAVQAALTFLACRGEPPPSDGTVSGWLSTLPVSPFLPLGLVWAALGNVLLAAVFACFHFAVLRLAWRCSGRTSTLKAMASKLLFPRLSIAAAEWLLTGIAVCGAAAAAGAAGHETLAYLAGWFAVTVSTALVFLWLLWVESIMKGPSPLCTVSAVDLTAPMPNGPLVPFLFRLLRHRYKWSPSEEASRTGTLYEAMRGRGCTYWWRWACLAVMTTVAGVAGAGGVRGGGCEASLSVCAFLLLSTALLLAIVRPHTLPSENLMNPIKFALLGATCLSLVVLYGDDQASVLATLGSLQTVVVVVRLSVKGYLRIETLVIKGRQKKNKKNGSLAEQDVASTAQVLLGYDGTIDNDDDVKGVEILRPRGVSPCPRIDAESSRGDCVLMMVAPPHPRVSSTNSLSLDDDNGSTTQDALPQSRVSPSLPLLQLPTLQPDEVGDMFLHHHSQATDDRVDVFDTQREEQTLFDVLRMHIPQAASPPPPPPPAPPPPSFSSPIDACENPSLFGEVKDCTAATTNLNHNERHDNNNNKDNLLPIHHSRCATTIAITGPPVSVERRINDDEDAIL